ncbi:MFS transporter [Methylomarinum vadi]|uniref:MFS transporter n=1 Tax=Methylomarinum vadi TaxID=438855 RepID=UPI0004DF6C62|nr:MFS transporter [Methylomarinum vadi]
MPVFVINLFSLRGKMKILHMSWLAFLISFIVWFNHAPLMLMIQQDVGLTQLEVNIILLLNVALTIPARLLVGVLVDRYGARLSYSVLLAVCSLPCFLFALADSFAQLAWARFLLGGIGAGFVVGIRIIGDWFPSRQMGTAEGIYAGWGNCGSAVAAMLLPGLALYFGGENGWRFAIALTGLLSLGFAGLYYVNVSNLPDEKHFLQRGPTAILEVSSIRDLFLYIFAIAPLYGALSLLVWKLSRPEMALLSDFWVVTTNLLIWSVFFYHAYKAVDLNAERLNQPVAIVHRFKFNQVLVLGLLYLATFGSKLAVVSMLPIFFYQTFNATQQITLVDAGLLAACFVLLNLVARPVGGWLSDRFGRKSTLTLYCAGLTLSYVLMSQISPNWPIALAVAVTLLCSVFLQGAEGAVFAVVPLVKRSMTGQIAGIVGAYGNAGTILFLVILTFVPASSFFLILALFCLLSLGAVVFLDEPKSVITEIMPDGTLAVIELD